MEYTTLTNCRLRMTRRQERERTSIHDTQPTNAQDARFVVNDSQGII